MGRTSRIRTRFILVIIGSKNLLNVTQKRTVQLKYFQFNKDLLERLVD